MVASSGSEDNGTGNVTPKPDPRDLDEDGAEGNTVNELLSCWSCLGLVCLNTFIEGLRALYDFLGVVFVFWDLFIRLSSITLH